METDNKMVKLFEDFIRELEWILKNSKMLREICYPRSCRAAGPDVEKSIAALIVKATKQLKELSTSNQIAIGRK